MAKATLIAKRLHCNQSFPMMRHLFDAVVKPTVSYGCEVWGTLCSGSLQPGLKGMAGLQIAFFRQILKLRKSISPHVIFAELAEVPWQRTWWSQVLRFMHRLDSMDEGSLHPDILSDNIHDALGNPGCCNWAAGVQKPFASRWVCHLPFQVARFAMLIPLLFARSCWPETCLCGKAFTFRHVLLPLKVPSFAPICGGRTGLARSPITRCPFQ